MAATRKPGRAPRPLTELPDVYAFLDEIRLRPGMWVPRGSLSHLESVLLGYRVALAVHDIDEPFDFWNSGGTTPFADWLWTRPGMPDQSSLSWATEIERAAERTGRPAMEMFFELLDEFRATGATGTG
ncbi:hypothetical protein [Streptomyces sp. NBC_01506]|uniref:hypothetical protein n=1 Tax=Streptomyces sp. NBC_01506 TaxID=2903887 RepID=UPI00386812D8